MKKILALLLALTFAVSLTACGIGQEVGQKKSEKKEETKVEEIDVKEVNFEEVVWEKYDEMPLYDVVTNGLTNLVGEEYEISVSFKDGWSDTTELNENDLEEGVSAVTMVIHMPYQDVNYFLEFDGTKFVVAGSEWISGDIEEFADVESSVSLLDELVVAVVEE